MNILLFSQTILLLSVAFHFFLMVSFIIKGNTKKAKEWFESRDFKDSNYDFVYKIGNNSFELVYKKE